MFIIPGLTAILIYWIISSFETAGQIRQNISNIYFNALHKETLIEDYSENEHPLDIIEELNKETVQ